MTNGAVHLLHRLPTSVPVEHPQRGRELSSISIATSPFTGAPRPKQSSQRSIPLLCLPSEHVEHLQTGVVCVSQMAHLPFRVCVWHCAAHIGHVLGLSGNRGFFASSILHSGVVLHRRFLSARFSGVNFNHRSSPRT